MAFLLVAVAVGTGLGLLAGGRLRNLGDARFVLRPLLAAALLAQLVAGLADAAASAVAVVASYAFLVAFAAANLHVVGMGLVVLGTAMNLVVIAANGSMPVRAEAVVAAGLADWDEVAAVDFGAKRHLEQPGDRLVLLGDIVPVPGVREVLSFGDLVLAVGAADVCANLVRSSRARRRATRGGGVHSRVAQPG